MADPALIDLIVDRNVPFKASYAFLNQDFAGSTLRVQVRAVKNTTGPPLIDGTSPAGFAILYAGTATVSAHIAAGRLPSDIKDLINPATGDKYVDGDSLLLSQIGCFLTTSGFPTESPETGDDWEGWYDVIREPASGDNELIMRGKFTVRAGVTIP